MMRLSLILTLLAAPALAQDPPQYDPMALEQCLADKTTLAERETCVGIPSGRCMQSPGGDTTAGMVHCLGVETAQWDDRLNRAYAALLAREEMDDEALARLQSAAEPAAPALREMQRAWIAFRDASCKYEAALWQGGSGAGPAANACALDLTGRQALRLMEQADTPR